MLCQAATPIVKERQLSSDRKKKEYGSLKREALGNGSGIERKKG
jgi:hypothetical protein